MLDIVLHEKYFQFPEPKIQRTQMPLNFQAKRARKDEYGGKLHKQILFKGKSQIKQYSRPKSKNFRQNLINRTIEFLNNSRKNSVNFGHDHRQTQSSTQRSFYESERRNMHPGHSLKSKRRYAQYGDFSLDLCKQEKTKQYTNKQYFQNAFKSITLRNYKSPFKVQNTQLLSLQIDKKNIIHTERKTAPMVKRASRKTEERQRRLAHYYNNYNIRPNTTQNNYEKKITQMLQPW